MSPKRKFPTVCDQVPAKLSTHRGGECFAFVLTRQLSLGGCTINGRHGMAPGSVLDATLFLEGRCVSATSRVLYERECGGENVTGLEFLTMAPDDLAALENYIGRKLQPAAHEGADVVSVKPSLPGSHPKEVESDSVLS